MRIDRLEVQNFKKFSKQTLELHPQFTLFVGENGAGKTSVLDALAVAASVWLAEPPDPNLNNSRRNILPAEIRLESTVKGDRTQFQRRRPVVIHATGKISDHENISWKRQIRLDGTRTTNAEAKEALGYIRDVYARDSQGEHVLCPVLAYYGAGRAWLSSNQRVPKPKANGPAMRWAAFYDCFSERIRFAELQQWFSREAKERGNRQGRWRPGFDVVRHAILRCVPNASDVSFDADLDQVILSIDGHAQPFGNLSGGQRMMLALVADLAIKAVTQNAFLIPSNGLQLENQTFPPVLQQTPGVVLIDELDVHLHPNWQRRVATDLKTVFPSIQFCCTSHSPQVIGETKPEEIRLLGENDVTRPKHSYGIDSSRILEEVMDAKDRNESVQALLSKIFSLIDKEDFAGARILLGQAESELGEDDPEITRARSLMSFLQSRA